MAEALRLLMVQHSADDATLVVRMLGEDGFVPGWRREESEAGFRQALNNGPWDVVIADFPAPSFDALEAGRVVRELGIDLPVIAVSDGVGEHAVFELLKSGVQGYALKDRLDQLGPIVRRVLAEAAEERRRREADAALRHGEALLSGVVYSAMDAIITVNANQRIVIFNRAAEQMFGWAVDEVIGKPLDVLIPAAFRVAHRRQVREFGANGVTSRTMTSLNVLAGLRADGTEFPIEATISHVDVNSEKFYTAVVRDITERRRLENELLQAQKMEAIGRLAGGVAHDFNNLLTAITGYGELTLLDPGDIAGTRANVGEMLAAAARAASLTRQLLALSRREALEATIVDLNAVISDMDRMLKRVIGEDIALRVELAGGARHIRADRGQIEQVILNLAVNARDAMPVGGTLLIRSETRLVEDGDSGPSLTPGEYAALSVIDTGHGVEPHNLQSIFEPFFTTKESDKGTGLGLSIVRDIVEQSGGLIDVESSPGAGAAFRIVFPCVAAAPEPAPVASHSLPATGTESVLLVEDDDTVRALERHLLERAGYEVRAFARPADAIVAALERATPVDILVTDVVMPVMSGPALARALRERWPSLRVLFLSGHTGEAMSGHGMVDGAALLAKPFSPEALTRRVREVLDQQI